MWLLEDLLSDDEIASIEKILASHSVRFDLLAEISGLDFHTDFQYSDFRRLNFCGADLRGFNFTGSDLRQAIRDDDTLIDETTILVDAKVDWIEKQALPIVLQMQKIEAATSSEQRENLLTELTSKFGISKHVIMYMTAAAGRAKNLEEFLDFAYFLPSELNENQLTSLRSAAQKLLKKRLQQTVSRTRRESTMIFALDKIVAKLQAANGGLAEDIYSNLVDTIEAKAYKVNGGRIAEVTPVDMAAALSRMGNKI